MEAVDGSEATLRARKKAEETEEKPQPGPISQASVAEDQKRDVVYGRTPDEQIFAIPHTHNVLAGLFDPRLPKSSLDLVTLSLLSLQVVLWLCLPLNTSRYLFMGIFAVFRLAYNAGLGYALTQQSKKRWIVNTVKRKGWLDENKHPKIKAWIERQVTIKMEKGYKFDNLPVEWNVWVLFRHSVDIILLNDFLAYFLCGISFMTRPKLEDSSAVLSYSLRWVSGLTLIVFNLWVKTDAHRIITDLAWYWADTFFSSSLNLVFDGVFEMAPHPMYSIGYSGFYGLCLIVGSETLLYISLAAHACQFAFLVFFEDPHIQRTYGERKPLAMRVPMQSEVSLASAPESPSVSMARPTAKTRQASTSSSASTPDSLADTPIGTDESDYDTDTDATTHMFRRHVRRESDTFSEDLDAEEGDLTISHTPTRPLFSEQSAKRPHLQSKHDFDAHYFRHDLLMLQNFDPLRATDFSMALVVFYLGAAFFLPLLSPKSQLVAIFINALAWRGIHTFVLGSILKAQSEKKWMVRHFLKHYHYEGTGYGAVEEAFNNWKAIYNISLCLVYASFGLLALKCYDWSLTQETLRHTLGLLLVALHVWSAKAIFEVLGRFGWFYADFFISGEGTPPQLLYTGIYRHVNNPERIMGGAAFFGLALISGSKLVGVLAVISVLSHFWFLSCVENPHMKRLYGSAIRKEAGVTKTFRTAASKNSHRAPPQVKRAVQEFQGTIERVYDDTQMAVEDFLKRSAPRLTGYVQNTKVLLKEQGERLLITRVANVAALDKTAYALKLHPSELIQTEKKDNNALPDLPRAKQMAKYQLGEAIQVDWTAPANCTRRDWIGLYRFGGNKSKLVTRIRSHGRWLGIYPDEWDGDESLAKDGASGSLSADKPSKKGSLVYKDRKIFWKTGQYEFRYHHDGKHNVMAVSEPFEVIVDKPRDLQNYQSVYSTLLPLVTRCLNSDPALVPESAYPLLAEKPDEETQAKIHAERTDPDDFVIFETEQAERIASVLAQSCGLERTAEVVMAEANVARLARSVVDAGALLRPFNSVEESRSPG